MITSIKDLNKVPDELSYNKYTIAVSTAIAISSYFFWEYTHGIITWLCFLLTLLLILVAASYTFLGLMFFGFFIITAFIFIPKFFFYNFWDAITLNITEEIAQVTYPLIFLYRIKMYFLAHPELGAFWTAILLICLLWKHPEQNNDDYDDYDEDSEKKQYANNPFNLIGSIIRHPSKLFTPIMMVLCGFIAYTCKNEVIIVSILWLLVFCGLRFIRFVTPKKSFWLYFLLYCAVFGAFTVLGGNSSIPQNLYDFIMLETTRMPLGLGGLPEIKEGMTGSSSAAALCAFFLPYFLKLTSTKKLTEWDEKSKKKAQERYRN